MHRNHLMLRFALAFAVGMFACAANAYSTADEGHETSHDAATTTHAESSDSHAATSGHAEEKKSILTADIGNVVWTLIIFGLVVLILRKAAWGPLVNLLSEREKTIRDSLETAQRERLEAERMMAEYKQQLDQAREQATAIVDEGRRDAEVVKRRIQDEAREESDRMITRAKNEIQLATDSAIKQLYDETSELAVNVARGIIGKELSADDHRQLVQESLDKMRQSRQATLN